MAKARMLHGKISRSIQVNKLPHQARLLFSWMIAHADDDGRLRGEPEYIKATVVPMVRWSFSTIKNYLEKMRDVGLISYWEQDDEWFVEFPKWKDHQTIQKDRYHQSNLPSFTNKSVYKSDTENAQNVDEGDTQSNISEDNKEESNRTEESDEEIGDIDSFKVQKITKVNPNFFSPMNDKEQAALEAWERIEPDNPDSFGFYLWAANQGLPTSMFYELASEIEQDESIENPGAVFNVKVMAYLAEHSNEMGGF